MRDLDALAVPGKQHRVVADDVAGADHGKADGVARAFAADAVTGIHRAVLEIPVQRRGHDLTHADGRARRTVHFVAVVCLGDFDIHGIAQHPRRGFQQLEAQVHAHAHIGCKNNSDVLGGIGNLLLPGVIEAGGADDEPAPVLLAEREMTERGLGAGEVNQHVEVEPIELVAQRNAETSDTGELAGIRTEGGVAGTLGRARQAQAFALAHGLHQRPAHAPGGAGNGDVDHWHSGSLARCFSKPSVKVSMCKPASWSSLYLSIMPPSQLSSARRPCAQRVRACSRAYQW